MNLMSQAMENIYNYGNTTLNLLNDPKWNISFYVGNNGKLTIKAQINDDYDDYVCDELDSCEGITYISLLAYYSVNAFARKKDLVYLTSDRNKNDNSKLNIVAVNDLYNQLQPLISTKRDNIEFLVKNNCTYESFANMSQYRPNSKMLDIQDLMKSIVDKFYNFSETLKLAIKLFNQVGEGQADEAHDAFCKWNNLLNYLYLQQFSDDSINPLSKINLDYEILTEKEFDIDSAVNVEEEIENLEIALLTPNKSAILVGPPGVGKTAIIYELARRIKTGNVPLGLRNKKILKINTSSIIKGCSLQGQLESKVEAIMRYLIDNPDTILFIDEIHTVIGAGAGVKDNLDIANMIKPYIDRGQIKIIGATTDEEYDKYVKSDKAFNRRFIRVPVTEPVDIALYEILDKIIKNLEKSTKVKWTFSRVESDFIIKSIIECTREKNRVYNDKRYNPDISITILEKSFALALLRNYNTLSFENISEAILKSEFFFFFLRKNFAKKIISQSNASIGNQDGNGVCKIIKFPRG